VVSDVRAVHAQASEHILLQSEARDVPARGNARIVHAALQCHSRLRMRRLELAIIDYYYLAVRATRTGSVRDYVLDLRFVDSSIRTTRHIPTRCILATLVLASVAAFSIRQVASSTAPWWYQHQLPLCATTLGLTVCAGLICAWRMTETFALRSLHGGATLLEFTGGPGTLRSSRKFALKLSAHIQFAVSDRRATKNEHLRDEMREHFRLREAGVLSQEQYEDSKAEILAQHAPVRRNARRGADLPSRAERARDDYRNR
jgi:hypothetical protein